MLVLSILIFFYLRSSTNILVYFGLVVLPFYPTKPFLFLFYFVKKSISCYLKKSKLYEAFISFPKAGSLKRSKNSFLSYNAIFSHKISKK